MSKSGWKCTVSGHETISLEQVCFDTSCPNGGLLCEKCVTSTLHQNHLKMPLITFIEQFKEAAKLNNYQQQLEVDKKNLQSVHNEIKAVLLGFQKSVQDSVTQSIERLNRQFENEQGIYQNLILAEQKHIQIATDLEKKANTPNSQEAQKKVYDLLSRTTVLQNKRLSLLPANEIIYSKSKQALSDALLAKENASTETTKIAKDTQAYLDNLYRFLLQQQQQQLQSGIRNNPQIQNNSLNHGSTFGILPHQSILSSNNNNNNSMLKNNNFNNFDPSMINNNSNFNNQQIKNNQRFEDIWEQGDQINNHLRQPQNNANFTLPQQTALYEIERNNENRLFRQNNHQQPQQSFNRSMSNNQQFSPSPFREEIHIANSPARSLSGRNKTQNYFGPNQNINEPIKNVPDNNFERSNSLANNIGHASSQGIGSPHLQYFLGASNPINNNFHANRNTTGQDNYLSNSNSPLGQRNNLVNQDPSFSGQPLSQNLARTSGNRVWWKAHEGPVRDIIFIDGDKVATCSNDCTIKLWDLYQIKLISTLSGHTLPVCCLTYNQNARILASGSADKTIKIWRPVPQWQCVNTFKGNYDVIRSLEFQNELVLISGGLDNVIKMWDLERGNLLRNLQPPSGKKVNCMLMLTSSSLLVGHENIICAWDLRKEQVVQELDAHQGSVVKLVFIKGRRKDQALVVSAGKDSSVKIWEASTLILLKSFEETFQITDIVYIPFSDQFAVSLITTQKQDGHISFWSLATLKKVGEATYEQTGFGNKLSYDDNHKLLFSAHENNQIVSYKLK